MGGSNSDDRLFVRIYDVTSGRLEGSLNVLEDDVLPGDSGSCTWRNDAGIGISFFPTHNGGGGGGGGGPGIKFDGLLAVAVGSRWYKDVQSEDDDECSNSDCIVVNAGNKRVVECRPGFLQLHGMQNISVIQ